MPVRGRVLALAAVAVLLGAGAAWAQAKNPFSVGISEGGGAAQGVAGWLLAQQSVFERALGGAVKAARQGGGLWTLLSLSFAYGVFHAAGPGHGKALVASYMLANEQALRRGLVISLCAAVLQGVVAVALVAGMAVLLRATSVQMKAAAGWIELTSYGAIAALGAWLVWRKGHALLAAFALTRGRLVASNGAVFACEPCETGFGSDCGHLHAPDPRLLGREFSWRTAAATVLAAGLRPCSGAILVLVFALAQGAFAVGVEAVIAMSLGTALTTGALAAAAVLAKSAALRMLSATSQRSVLIGRGVEVIAAAAVLFIGLSLLAGASGRLG